MSKAFSTVMDRLRKKWTAGPAVHEFLLFDQLAAKQIQMPPGVEGAWELHVPVGAQWMLLERCSAERIEVQIKVGENASLKWLSARMSGGDNVRQVAASLGKGSALRHREALRLGSTDSMGQSWSVEMSQGDAVCDIASRLAQAPGATACLAYDAALRRGSEGSSYAQVAKAMREGDSCFTLIEPNLTVQAARVAAKHGASHGKHDPAAQHALMARGFGDVHAREMLTQAFLSACWEGMGLTVDQRSFLEGCND